MTYISQRHIRISHANVPDRIGHRLSSSTGKPSSSVLTSLAERTADSGAIEASVVWEQDSFYYLFTSWDLCCEGLNSTYNIRVGRSSRSVVKQTFSHTRHLTLCTSSVNGPFIDQSGVDLNAGGGTLVLGTHGSVSPDVHRLNNAEAEP